jgi:hypothetical protein
MRAFTAVGGRIVVTDTAAKAKKRTANTRLPKDTLIVETSVSK